MVPHMLSNGVLAASLLLLISAPFALVYWMKLHNYSMVRLFSYGSEAESPGLDVATQFALFLNVGLLTFFGAVLLALLG